MLERRPSDQASQVSGYRRFPFCRARRVVSSSLCAWEQLPRRSVNRRIAWCPGAKPLLAANNLGVGLVQWPFQDPIDWRYLPYIRPIFQAYVRGYPHKIWPYMVLTYLHFRILEFPLISWLKVIVDHSGYIML